MKKPSLLKQKNKPNLTWLVFFVILLLFTLACYLSLRFGAVNYSQAQLWQILGHPFTNSAMQDIVIDLRLPRLLAATLVGAAMSQAGAIMQGVTRNPIADPGLLGINRQSPLQSHSPALPLGVSLGDPPSSGLVLSA